LRRNRYRSDREADLRLLPVGQPLPVPRQAEDRADNACFHDGGSRRLVPRRQRQACDGTPTFRNSRQLGYVWTLIASGMDPPAGRQRRQGPSSLFNKQTQSNQPASPVVTTRRASRAHLSLFCSFFYLPAPPALLYNRPWSKPPLCQGTRHRPLQHVNYPCTTTRNYMMIRSVNNNNAQLAQTTD
jgi:hypothetical protein